MKRSFHSLLAAAFCFATMSKSTHTEGYSIVIGLNPALQKRFILSEKTPNLIPGNVHRASSVQEGIGGKGQDVAVTLACLSKKSTNIYLAQLVGSGVEGDLAMSKLNDALNDELDAASASSGQPSDLTSSWAAATVRTKAALRTCTTIVSNDVATELVEPSGTIQPEEIDMIKYKIDAIASSNIRGLCIMGSMPPGCQENLYAELYGNIAKSSPKMLTVIDTVVGLDHLFQQMRKSEREGKRGKIMLKVNFAEFCRLSKCNGFGSSLSESSSASPDQVETALSSFLDVFEDAKDALDFIAITNGCHPAHLVCVSTEDPHMFSLDIPDLCIVQDKGTTQVYPIGAGDSVAGGTLAAWEYLEASNDDSEQRLDTAIQKALKEKVGGNESYNIAATALSFGIACGSASCVQEENSVLEPNHALALFLRVKIRKLS